MKRSLGVIAAMMMTATGPAGAQDETERPEVVLHTSMGDIRMALYADRVPTTVENFLQYVRDGHYDGTVFHRVIPSFMIQGGGFTPDLTLKPVRDPIQNEATPALKNTRGTVAMARTMERHSATSQFFINVVDNRALDYTGEHSSQAWGYAVFGEVIDGMDVVDAIRNVPTGTQGPHRDVPLEPVVIESAEVVSGG